MSRLPLPRSLFGQTSLILSVALILFLTLVIGVTFRLIMLPVAERATADFAALMVLSAQTWAELPPGTRPDFERVLSQKHQISLVPVEKTDLIPLDTGYLPYIRLIKISLEKRLDRTITVGTVAGQDGWYWFDIPIARHLLRIGFPDSRLAQQTPLATLIIFVIGAIFILITSMLLVSRLIKPLARLAEKADEIGTGQFPSPMPEHGPNEIAALARGFNHMAYKIKGLLANRTTLLAGISHDIRTPLTHMALAMEMLPVDTNPQIRQQLDRDLEQINTLINQVMELSRGLDNQDRETIEIYGYLQEFADNRGNSQIVFQAASGEPCLIQVSEISLRRILFNLLDNAVRYAEGTPVELACNCENPWLKITVSDQGPGIPEVHRKRVFEPFFRLEASRNRETGGSGLGLAVVSQLADANGWRIRIGDNPHGGTDVVLEIPR